MAVVASLSVNPGLIGAERGAELRDAVTDVEGGEIGGSPPHHPVERRDALGGQAVGGPVGTGVELGERSLLVAEGRAALRRRDGRGAGEDVVDPDVHRQRGRSSPSG